MIEQTLTSVILGNQRRLWLELPPERPSVLCILLDGEYSVDRLDFLPINNEEDG